MKKIWMAFLLVFCMIFSTFSASAEGVAKFVINTPETLPKAGEEFTVTVDLINNPDVNSVQFTLVFDKNALECKEAYVGEVLEKSLSAVNSSADEGAIIAAASVKTLTGDGMLGGYIFIAKKDIEAFDFKLKNVELTNEQIGVLEFELPREADENAGDEPVTESKPDDQPVTEPKPDDEIVTETEPDDETVTEIVTPPVVSGGGGNSDSEEKEELPEIQEPEEKEEVEEKPEELPTFADMSGHWAEDFVKEAAGKGLFKGDDKGNFNPDLNVTRAQFVTVLWRMAGKPEVNEVPPFEDTKNELDEFKTAIAWGYANGYISGISETEFEPSGTLTREAAMKILHYHSGGKTGEEFKLIAIYDGTFKDSGDISSWAKPSVYWGIYNKLISGMSDTELAPKGTATRAQLAKILVSYLNEYNN